jgi:glycerol-3-phosphate acyltransferase PlsY
MTFITIILFAYLLGAIPWGYIIAKFKGVDIQKKGSGSTGATNVYRNLGLPTALLVAVLDILKGTFAMLVAILSLNSHYEIAWVALAVIVGHIYSIFLKGKGGKGIATTFGVLIILIGWKALLSTLVIWILLLSITRLMSLTNLLMICVFPLYFLFIKPDLAFFLLGTVVTFLIYWVHSDNIDRLKAGKELQLDVKVGFTKTKKKRAVSKIT